jgi:hypothetical protein
MGVRFWDPAVKIDTEDVKSPLIKVAQYLSTASHLMMLLI